MPLHGSVNHGQMLCIMIVRHRAGDLKRDEIKDIVGAKNGRNRLTGKWKEKKT